MSKKELNTTQALAILAMSHNYRAVKGIEENLQSFVEEEQCYVYLKNPNGERIRVLPGFEIDYIEIVPCDASNV